IWCKNEYLKLFSYSKLLLSDRTILKLIQILQCIVPTGLQTFQLTSLPMFDAYGTNPIKCVMLQFNTLSKSLFL
ncbi:MAG: hypothetical protein RBR97_15505, partial [Bacteroidales bacterium]|nr:hypothetical protein [Bacteroidales bacterium]